MRVPLLLDGEPAAVLEICPGCGTGHDKAAAYTEAAPQAPSTNARVPPSFPGWLRGLRPSGDRPACAWMHCAKRSRRVVYGMETDDGTMTYWFSSRRCRKYWCAYYGLKLP